MRMQKYSHLHTVDFMDIAKMKSTRHAIFSMSGACLCWQAIRDRIIILNLLKGVQLTEAPLPFPSPYMQQHSSHSTDTVS